MLNGNCGIDLRNEKVTKMFKSFNVECCHQESFVKKMQTYCWNERELKTKTKEFRGEKKKD